MLQFHVLELGCLVVCNTKDSDKISKKYSVYKKKSYSPSESNSWENFAWQHILYTSKHELVKSRIEFTFLKSEEFKKQRNFTLPLQSKQPELSDTWFNPLCH